ncbi:MAG: efflux RND transporter periplasmic adaptor subunit, partial [Caldimonas sp.]
ALQATIAKDQAQTAKDQGNSDVAQVTVQRDQDLVKKQVDPQSTLDTDMAVAKAAQATVSVDNAQLKADQVELAHMIIKAPMAGRVGTVNTSVGNVVHASDTSTGGLLTITQMTPLRVSFSVAESDLDGFRTALAGSKSLPVEITAPGDKSPRAAGTLSFIDSSVDTGSGTVVIKADVDNGAGKLWPGQYVSATTQLGAYTNATTIPLVAVQESNIGPYVWLVSPDGKSKQQPITVQASIGDSAIISKGVKPGDHVVTEGQLRLSDGSAVKETIGNKTTSVAANGDTATATGGSDSGALAGAAGSASAPASTTGSSAGAGAAAANS